VFACIAYAVSGLIGSPDAAQPIVQATMLPLWFISGAFIPIPNLPSTLRRIEELFPVAPGEQPAARLGAQLVQVAVWPLASGWLRRWRLPRRPEDDFSAAVVLTGSSHLRAHP